MFIKKRDIISNFTALYVRKLAIFFKNLVDFGRICFFRCAYAVFLVVCRQQAKFQLKFDYAHAIMNVHGVIAREGIRKFDALTGRFLTHRRIGIMMW